MLLSDERHKTLNIPWSTEIDLINVTYKNMIEVAGNDVDAIKERLIEYLALIYETYGKDACIVPAEYINYVLSTCSKNFGYMSFEKAISEFQSRYSVVVYRCDCVEGCFLDYLFIQKTE